MTTTMPDTAPTDFMKLNLDVEDDDQDADKLAHIINMSDNEDFFPKSCKTSFDIVEYARKHRFEVIALCGHKFIPMKDPDVLDACHSCLQIAGVYMREAGE